MKHVCILGGGLSGLSLAYYLRKIAPLVSKGKQLRVTILEGSNRWGGWIHTFKQDGFVLEKGPRGLRYDLCYACLCLLAQLIYI